MEPRRNRASHDGLEVLAKTERDATESGRENMSKSEWIDWWEERIDLLMESNRVGRNVE